MPPQLTVLLLCCCCCCCCSVAALLPPAAADGGERQGRGGGGAGGGEGESRLLRLLASRLRLDAGRSRRSADRSEAPAAGRRRAAAADGFLVGRHSKVEVSAALKVDGKTCVNVTKLADTLRISDSKEVIAADIGDAVVSLSMKVIKKTKGGSARVNGTQPKATAGSHRRRATEAAEPPLQQAEVVQAGPATTECPDTEFCLFGGTCVYYTVLGSSLCRCPPGHMGRRCELYDLQSVLLADGAARKRRRAAFSPEQLRQIVSEVAAAARRRQ